MTESESVALPLGDAPIFSTAVIIADFLPFVNTNFQLFFIFLFGFLKKSQKMPFFTLQRPDLMVQCVSIYPWHSWIARQTPTLKASGSNPLGQAKKKSRASGFSFCILHSSLFTLLFSLNLSARLFQRRDKREERKEKVAFLPLVEKH